MLKPCNQGKIEEPLQIVGDWQLNAMTDSELDFFVTYKVHY